MGIYQGSKKVANNYYFDNTVYCVPIGTIISYTTNTPPSGFLICDGSEVNKTEYADLYKILGDTFGTSTDATKFKLPDLRDKFIQGTNGNLGSVKDAGLPNITGNFKTYDYKIAESSGCITKEISNSESGADIATGEGVVAPYTNFSFNASKSNSIYGSSNTVQPPAVCLTYIIKSTKQSDVPIEATSVINDNSITEDRTWSSKKIKNSIIPYYLINTSKDIDFNEYTETGYYTPNKTFSTGWFTHSILNAPTDDWLPAGGFALEVKTFDTENKWFTQVLYSYVTYKETDNNTAPVYTRTFFYDSNNSKTTFSPWKRIADIDDSKISEGETWSSKKIDNVTSSRMELVCAEYKTEVSDANKYISYQAKGKCQLVCEYTNITHGDYADYVFVYIGNDKLPEGTGIYKINVSSAQKIDINIEQNVTGKVIIYANYNV